MIIMSLLWLESVWDYAPAPANLRKADVWDLCLQAPHLCLSQTGRDDEY